MADTDPNAGAGGSPAPPAEDRGEAEVAALRERLAGLEATVKEREVRHQSEIEALKASRPQPDPNAADKLKVQFNEAFEKDPAGAMAAYEQQFLHPNLQKIAAMADNKVNAVMEKIARNQRDEILRDDRCSPEILEEVDGVAKQLDRDRLSEPGAYREILESVLKKRAWAEMELNGTGKGRTGMRTRRGPEADAEDEGGEPLTAEEIRWAKRWKLDAKTFKEYQGKGPRHEKELEW